MLTRELIMEQIAPVQDPELGLGLVDLGLIYNVDIKENNDVNVTMTLTTPLCPIADTFSNMVESAVKQLEEVNEVNVYIVFDPPWDPAEMASDAAKDALGIW